MVTAAAAVDLCSACRVSCSPITVSLSALLAAGPRADLMHSSGLSARLQSDGWPALEEEMLLTSRGTVRWCHILCYMLYTVCSISLVPGTCNYHQVPTGSQYPAEYCNPGPVQSRPLPPVNYKLVTVACDRL
ncbi:hypothetical protein FKM82_023907 [Ascaphus truei]